MLETLINKSRKILFESENFEIVEIFWQLQEQAEIHDHGWSECSVLVQEGVFENHLVLGFKEEKQIFEKGQVIHTPKGAKHSLRCVSKSGQTLHVYTPKIKKQSEVSPVFKAKISKNLHESLNLSEPVNFDSLKKTLSLIQKESVSTQSPYFMNQLFSGVLPQMLAAQDVIAQTKTTLATTEASPILSEVESEVVSKLCEQIGWNSQRSEGINVPGGSAANFMALQCAKQKKFPNFKKSGLNGQPLQIYVSEAAHYSFKKAAVAMGFGSDHVKLIPVDAKGCMLASSLDEAIKADLSENMLPLLVVATAGTTVFGAFDPIDEIFEIAQKHNIWLHVDAAWGGPAIFSRKNNFLVKGIEKAHSVTFDAHKLLGASMTCSYFLTKEKNILFEANDVSGADYLFHSTQGKDRGQMSWQCGRGADSLSFWTIWKNVGTAGFQEFVDRLILEREKVEQWITYNSRLKIIGHPQYLNLCVRVEAPQNFENEQFNWAKLIREELLVQQLAFVNFSQNEEGTFLRFILAHPETSAQHIIEVLTWALNIGYKNYEL